MSRTQLRLAQVTGSLGTTAGKIRPDDPAGLLSAKNFTDLSGSLSAVLSGLSRLHGRTGDNALNNTAGEFYQSLAIKTGGAAQLVIGDGTDSVDYKIIFDHATQDFYIGYDDTDDKLKMGVGSTVGTTPNMTLNSADRDVAFLGNIDVATVATAATFEPDGDVAAGDNAAIGYTAADGIIITGQGSTNDVTIKNDLKADVISIATGGTEVEFAGNVKVGGDIVGDADEAKNIFLASTSPANSITIGAGADVVLGGDLKLGSTGIIEDSGGDARFTATNAGVTAIGRADGTTAIEVQTDSDVHFSANVQITGNIEADGNNSASIFAEITNKEIQLGGGANVVIPGSLTVQGTTTALTSSNTVIQDAIIAIGTSGSEGYAPAGIHKGIIFGDGAKSAAQSGLFFDGTRFQIGSSLTGPLSGTFSIASTDFGTLRGGTFELGGTTNRLLLDSSNVTLDAAADIVLDAAGEQIILKDGSAEIAHLSLDSSNLTIETKVSDKDILFKGLDGAGVVTALELDISNAGRATFNERVISTEDVHVGDDLKLISDAAVFSMGDSQKFRLTHANSNNTAIVTAGDRLAFGSVDRHIVDNAGALEVSADGDLMAIAGAGITLDGAKIDLAFAADIRGALTESKGSLILSGGHGGQAGSGIFLDAHAGKFTFRRGSDQRIEGVLESDSSGLLLSASADGGLNASITLDSPAGAYLFDQSGTEFFRVDKSNDDAVLKTSVSNGNIIFQDDAGHEAFRMDGGLGALALPTQNATGNSANTGILSFNGATNSNFAIYSNGTNLFLRGGSGVNFRLPNSAPASNGLTLKGNTNGQLFFDTSAVVKGVYVMTASLAADSGFNVGSTNGQFLAESAAIGDMVLTNTFGQALDVYVNGLLLSSGSTAQVTNGTRDYAVASDVTLKFAFGLESDDVIQVINRN